MNPMASGFPIIESSFDINTLTGKDVTFVNPFSWLELTTKVEQRDLTRFKIFADGIGVVWFYNFFLNTNLSRVSFDYTSIAQVVLEHAALNKWKVFLIGGKEGIAKDASSHFIADFPTLIITGTVSGYFINNEHQQSVLRNALAADLVIVGMGTPYQEHFLLKLRDLGWQGTGFTCGGFFDQTTVKGKSYYPKIVDSLNIRWLYRLLDDPRRLAKRYLIIYPKFIFIFIGQYFKQKWK